MRRCHVFCAAEFDGLVLPIGEDDLVIAADGGLRHTIRLGIMPQVVLGDFDSLGYVPTGANVFPVEKDDTDAMLAVRQGLAQGAVDFILYGGLDGPRLDHTVANFQTLQYLADHGARGLLVGRDFLCTVIKDGSVTFDPAEGGISVFCMGAEALGVTIAGLYYTLENGCLSPGFPLGVSNHFTQQPARICVAQGSLLVIWERRAGLPREVRNDADL